VTFDYMEEASFGWKKIAYKIGGKTFVGVS